MNIFKCKKWHYCGTTSVNNDDIFNISNNNIDKYYLFHI